LATVQIHFLSRLSGGTRGLGIPLLLAGLALIAAPVAGLFAHDIPARVGILAFVRAEPDSARVRVVMRVPLEAMRDVIFPQLPGGGLDILRAEPLAFTAAGQWISDYLEIHADGEPLPRGEVRAVRISLPSDRSFLTYESALARDLGP
jgi:hypothetical protein